MDQYHCTMSLEKLERLDIPEMWIENGYRFRKEDEPYGLENGENFTLYMPETPIEKLSEDFMIEMCIRDSGQDVLKMELKKEAIRIV